VGVKFYLFLSFSSSRLRARAFLSMLKSGQLMTHTMVYKNMFGTMEHRIGTLLAMCIPHGIIIMMNLDCLKE
jgi:hypothetical protein